MSERIETITIQRCPKCGGSHTFQISIKRTTVMLLDDTGEEKKVRKITCLFNCPATGDPFQAKLKLKTTAKEKIASIDVQPGADQK